MTQLEKLSAKPGFLLAAYCAMYALYRFMIEFLREGYSAEMWRFGLTQAQGFSVLMFAAAMVFVVKLRKAP
jgi:prolipoprotein diacylglyceryltransferase